MSSGRLLVTGGAGYLGLRVARAWLEGDGDDAVLWVHTKDADDLATTTARVRAALGPAADRAECVGGDLAAAHPFESVDPQGITAIIHAAAATRFNIDETTADAVNVRGTEKLLEFALRCPRLESLVVLSSVYASGLRAGPVLEEPLADAAGFANHYERSKWASERLLFDGAAQRLPWRIARVATVIADDDTGRVSQYNAFHNTLKLFYYGLLSVIPGKPDTPLYFVTGDFAVRSVIDLLARTPAKTIAHVAHTRDESGTLGELIDVAFEVFGREPDFAKRRVLRPLYSDAEAFELLADGVKSFAGGVVNQAVGSVAPFARQLFVAKDVRNDRLRSVLSSYRAPDPRELIASTCRALVRSKWGRESADAR